MVPLKPEGMETELDAIWPANRDYLRRLLVSLTRDLDLADDLLQETYLRAVDGFAGYRGDNARAWLAAIAKNAFYAQARKKYYTSETPLDYDPSAEAEGVPGSADHVDVMTIREAISGLPEALRIPLIMKHYGDLTYKEIAERLSLPQGTVQQRVWTALQKLKSTLGAARKELARVTCEKLTGRLLIDFIYGKLSDEEARTVEEHLGQCSSCRDEAREIGEMLKALDAVEGAFKSTGIIELDEKGYITFYGTLDLPNESDEPMETLDFGVSTETEVVYFALNGEETPIEELPAEPDSSGRKYRARLTKPIPPRQKIEFLTVGRNPHRPVVERIGRDRYRFGPGNLNLTEDLVYVMALRLPPKATLVKATPEPQEIKKNGATTVVWRSVLPANTQLDFWVEYTLKGTDEASDFNESEVADRAGNHQPPNFGYFGKP